MPFRPSRIGLIGLAFFAAFTLTILSIYIQRKGPEEVVYSNLCGPTNDDLCYKKVLKGGFPIAYLFDAPGVSVEDQLAFGEDNFRGRAFLFDMAAYLAVILLAMTPWLRRGRHM